MKKIFMSLVLLCVFTTATFGASALGLHSRLCSGLNAFTYGDDSLSLSEIQTCVEAFEYCYFVLHDTSGFVDFIFKEILRDHTAGLALCVQGYFYGALSVMEGVKEYEGE